MCNFTHLYFLEGVLFLHSFFQITHIWKKHLLKVHTLLDFTHLRITHLWFLHIFDFNTPLIFTHLRITHLKITQVIILHTLIYFIIVCSQTVAHCDIYNRIHSNNLHNMYMVYLHFVNIVRLKDISNIIYKNRSFY